MLILTLMQPALANDLYDDATDHYAVIAVGPDGQRGFSNNHPSYGAAVASALKACGDSRCEMAVWVRGERCAAVAVGSKSTLSWGWAYSSDIALKLALDKCNSVDSTCWTAGVTCNHKTTFSGTKYASWAVTPAAETARAASAAPSHGGGTAPTTP